MSNTAESLGIHRLSAAERWALVQEIWDSIAHDVEQTPLSQDTLRELRRRLDHHDQHPEEAIPWEQVEAEALARLSR